jgi:HK97 family phage major capsid protein
VNKKALIEKKNELYKQFNNLFENDEEKRSFSKEQEDKIKELFNSITQIDEEIRSLDEQYVSENKSQNRKREFMNKEEKLEIRRDIESEAFSMRVHGKKPSDIAQELSNKYEVRDGSAGAGQAAGGSTATPAAQFAADITSAVGKDGGLEPTYTTETIIQRMQEASPAWAQATHVPSVNGFLQVPRETDVAKAGFVGEMEEAEHVDTKFDYVTLADKRIGAQLQLTRTMLDLTPIDLFDYAISRVGAAAGYAVERAMFVGDKAHPDKTFKPILGNNVESQRITLHTAKTPTVEELIDIKNSINPSYLEGAAWYVSRAVYNVISKLKDGDGAYLLFKSNVPSNGGVQTLMGFPIYVTDALAEADEQIVFGNMHRGYIVTDSSDTRLDVITADTTQAVHDGALVVLNSHGDGCVVDPYSFVTAK